MSSIYGIISRKGAPVLQEQTQAMHDAMNHWGANGRSEHETESFYFGGLCLKSKESDGHRQIFKDQHYVVLADATLYNKNELKQKLAIDAATNYADTALLYYAFLKWGADCPNHLNGEFAFVVYNQSTHEIFVARDHHGIKPLYYFINHDYFAFATEMKGLLHLPFISHDINEQYIADFICRVWLDNSQTLYRNINRFPPGHTARISEKGLQLSEYWHPENAATVKYNKESDYIDAFDELLTKAVISRTGKSNNVGSELSGGLDSSMVSALLQKSQLVTCTTYSYVLPPELEGKGLYSEKRKLKAFIEHTGIESFELLTDSGKGMLDSLEWNIRTHDEPPFDFNPLFRDGMYKKMQGQGQQILFSGFGGDEMVSSQASGYLKQLFIEGKKGLLKAEISALSKRKMKPNWLLYSSLYFKLLTSDRFLATANKNIRSLIGGPTNLEKKLLHRPLVDYWFRKLDMKDRFMEYQKRYTRNGHFMEDHIRRMQEPHVALRLDYQAHAARSFNIEYRYPLLDVELIEFYIGLPTELKARHGDGRYIFKKVLERYLPKEFVWRDTKKGSSNPQVLTRTNIDGKKVEAELFSIRKNHPLWNYLSEEKLRRNRIKFKNWHQSTTDFTYLLLADKLK